MSPLQRDPLALSGSGGMLHAEESALQAVGWSRGKQGARKRSEKERGVRHSSRCSASPMHCPGPLPRSSGAAGAGQGWGSAPDLCTPSRALCHEEALLDPPGVFGPGWGSQSHFTASCEWKEMWGGEFSQLPVLN